MQGTVAEFLPDTEKTNELNRSPPWLTLKISCRVHGSTFSIHPNPIHDAGKPDDLGMDYPWVKRGRFT